MERVNGTNRPIDVSVYNDLQRKSASVKWTNENRNEYLILFSKSCFADKIKEIAKEDNLLLFDLKKIEYILKIPKS